MDSEYLALLKSLNPVVLVEGVNSAPLTAAGGGAPAKNSGSAGAQEFSTLFGAIWGKAVLASTPALIEDGFLCRSGGMRANGIAGMENPTAGFSVVALVLSHNWSSPWARILSIGQGFIQGEIIFSRYNATNDLHIGWWNGGAAGPALYTTGDKLPAGKTFAVAATFSVAENKLRLYIDGAKVAESTPSAALAANSSRTNVTVGSHTGGGEYWDGIITLPAVFNYPLADAEIAQLAQLSTLKPVTLNGTVELVAGSGGKSVLVRSSRTGAVIGRAIPDAEGDWSVSIPDVEYFLDYVGRPGSRGLSANPATGTLAGSYPTSGVTVDGMPAQATVRVMTRPGSGSDTPPKLIAEVETDAFGEWQVTGLNPNEKYDVIFRKSGHNDLIVADVTPQV